MEKKNGKYLRTKKRKPIWPLLWLLAVLAAVVLLCGWLEENISTVSAPTESESQGAEPLEETTVVPAEPDLSAIPESLLELMEKNPETVDFVLNYPNRQELTVDWSEFDREAGVPLFLQWDKHWGYTIYGTDVLALTGCGPTCMAMAGYYLTGDEGFTPDQMAFFAEEEGYYAWGKGTSWTFFSEGAGDLGLESRELWLSESLIASELAQGRLVVLSMGPGDFTEHGHYILLVGYEDGMFRVNDPNSVIRSEKRWSYETLEPQIRNLWSVWVEN